MKRITTIIFFLCLLIICSACTNSKVDEKPDVPTTAYEPTASSSESNSDTPDVDTEETSISKEEASEVLTEVVRKSDVETTTAAATDPQQSTFIADYPATVKVQSEPITTHKQEEKQANQKTEAQKQETPSNQQPEPTRPIPDPRDDEETTVSVPVTVPEHEAKPEPDFDISYWIQYARNYAESVGLQLHEDAVYCWDNPIGANAKCIYLERDIQSRLNRYANDEDTTLVWIWSVELSAGNYEIYIGYA